MFVKTKIALIAAAVLSSASAFAFENIGEIRTGSGIVQVPGSDFSANAMKPRGGWNESRAAMTAPRGEQARFERSTKYSSSY